MPHMLTLVDPDDNDAMWEATRFVTELVAEWWDGNRPYLHDRCEGRCSRSAAQALATGGYPTRERGDSRYGYFVICWYCSQYPRCR